LPREYVQLWALWCKIYTNILHFHVLQQWMYSSEGFKKQLSQALTEFQLLYGVCNLPSNFHRLLHLVLDFQAWGNLRSHWAFPLERVYGALMTRTRHQNRCHVTVSVVNSIPRLYLSERLDLDREEPGRCLTTKPRHVLACSRIRKMVQGGANWLDSLVLQTSRRWHMGEYVCVLYAGKSLTSQCFFVLAGILLNNMSDLSSSLERNDENCARYYFVLRKVQKITSSRFFPRSAIFYTVPVNHENSSDFLGEQEIMVPSQLIGDNVSLSPVVQYTLDDDRLVLIPTCGLICFD
jgi:hypothetical protein